MRRLHILATSQKHVLSVSFPPAVPLCTCRNHVITGIMSAELLFKEATIPSASDQLLYLLRTKEVLTPNQAVNRQLTLVYKQKGT